MSKSNNKSESIEMNSYTNSNNNKNNNNNNNHDNNIRFTSFTNTTRIDDTVENDTTCINIIKKVFNYVYSCLYSFSLLFSLKSIIVMILLVYYNNISKFFNIMNRRYKKDDYYIDKNYPIDVIVMEKYIDIKNYINDVISYPLRLFDSSIKDPKLIRSKILKDHLLQEQIEEHILGKEAMIKIKNDKTVVINGKSRNLRRVRLNNGNLFKLLMNVKDGHNNNKIKKTKDYCDDRIVLKELLNNAREANEVIYNVVKEHYKTVQKRIPDDNGKRISDDNDGKNNNNNEEKDLYTYNHDLDCSVDHKDRSFFRDNDHFVDFLKDDFVFETKKTIYNKLVDFISEWLRDSADNGLIKNPTFEVLASQLKEVFIGFCKKIVSDFYSNNKAVAVKGYKNIINDFHSLFKEYEDRIDTFYLDEIKRFIMILLIRTDPSKSESVLDQIVNDVSKDSRGYISCFDAFDKIKATCSKLDDPLWSKLDNPFVSNKSKRASIDYVASPIMSNTNLRTDEQTYNGDEDIEWLRGLIEESRIYKWKAESELRKAMKKEESKVMEISSGQLKHFSEFTIDKVLIKKTDSAGANVIHAAFLYKMYENFGKYLVQQYPTIAILPFSNEVSYNMRLSSIKEGLHAVPDIMPFTGETILHMVVISRDLEQTRWILDFYRDHEHNTNNGLKTLLMTAATGSFFHQNGEFYSGVYPIQFAVCSNSKDMFDLILTYASNLQYNIVDSNTKIESKRTLGSTIIFIRDHFGNNCLHLAVHHKLKDMYEHILDSAKDFLRRDIKTAYAKQRNYGGERSQIIQEEYFPKLHDTMKFFLEDDSLGELFGFDRFEKPLHMPEDISQFDTWLQKQVSEKIQERFLYAMNNDLHTPLTLCAQYPKSEDPDDEKKQNEMLEFLLFKSTDFKWTYGPLSCSILSLEGFDYPMKVDNENTLYKPLCNYHMKDDNEDTLYKPLCKNDKYSQYKKLLSMPRKGILDWICYRDRASAAEIEIIRQYIDLKWTRFSTHIMDRTFYLSLIIALSTTIICCISNIPPTVNISAPDVIAGMLYIIVGSIYLYIFYLEVCLVLQYGIDYIGLQGGIRGAALYDKLTRMAAMLTFLALSLDKIIHVHIYLDTKINFDDDRSWQANDRPGENIPMAMTAIFSWIYLYFFFMASDKYGGFVITISRIICRDIPYFLAFYSVVIVSYACALMILTVSGDPLSVLGFQAFIYCFWELIQQTVNNNLTIMSEYSCTDVNNVSPELLWFYNIVITSFYFVVSIMMLNLLIAMFNNTYTIYSNTSESLLLLEKYNITCSLERYLSASVKDVERKKFAIEFDENLNDKVEGEKPKVPKVEKKWGFEHVSYDKSWNNNAVTDKVKLQERVVLLIICPQKDFMKGGSLMVPGADDNSEKIAKMIMDEKSVSRIDEIFVALDSHFRTHIAHATCWKHVESSIPDFERDGLITWKYPYDKHNPKKYDPCFTYLGVSVPFYVELYEKHSSHIEKTFQWKYCSYEKSEGTITVNFFLEEKETSSEKSSKIKEKVEFIVHRNKRYQSLPFQKVMTFKGSLALKEILKRSDAEIHKRDNPNLVEVEYWYHPKEFSTILNSDLKVHINSKRPLYEVIKNDAFDLEWADYYTENLEQRGRYQLKIWPEHCIIGTSGHSVADSLNNALQHWARKNLKAIQYIKKGENCKTELYSILEAEVEDPNDITTAFDANLFNQLKVADRIIICGQASSHCVKFTVNDLIRHWPEGDDRKKMIVLEDGCSSLEGYEAQAKQFFDDIEEKGLTVTTCSNAFSTIDAEIHKLQKIEDDEQDVKTKELARDNDISEIKNSIQELTALVKSLKR